MAQFHISSVLLIGIFFISTGNAEIYKWVDDKGNVHYGDCPPASCESEEVQIAPTPSDQAIKEAQDRFKHLQEQRKKMQESRKEDAKRTKKPAVSYQTDAKCFTSLEDAWEGKIPDNREKVQRNTLKNAELRRLTKLFQSLEGHWRGNIEDITCVRPDATPPTKTYHYDFSLDAQWESDQLFKIEADLEGTETRAAYRQFYWLFLSQEGLRFRKATTDISFKIDQPGNDVEILKIGNNSIKFFWRRGGPVRRTNVFSLRKAGRSFNISEFFYVQGMLAGKRFWTIER